MLHAFLIVVEAAKLWNSYGDVATLLMSADLLGGFAYKGELQNTILLELDCALFIVVEAAKLLNSCGGVADLLGGSAYKGELQNAFCSLWSMAFRRQRSC